MVQGCEEVGVFLGKLYCGRKRREGQPGSSEKRLLPPLTPQLALPMPAPGRSVRGLPREEQVGQPGREVAAKVPHTPFLMPASPLQGDHETHTRPRGTLQSHQGLEVGEGAPRLGTGPKPTQWVSALGM